MVEYFNVFDPKKSKTVHTGVMVEKCYYRVVPPSNIMRKIFKGSVGMSNEVIGGLTNAKCEYVAIYVDKGNYVYLSKFMDWITSPTGIADFGHGKQVFMDLSRMKVVPFAGFKPEEASLIYETRA